MIEDPDRLIPWSVSMLHVYETCPLQYKKKYIERIPEPERPLPPGKSEHANERGARIHEASELYVKGEREDLVEEAQAFEEDIEVLRDLYGAGSVMLEHDWCFDIDWNPCNRKERDSIFIVDVAVWLQRPDWLLVIDYKTGRPYPVKHMDQMQAYALAAFKKFPDLQQVSTELWYLDKDEISITSFKRAAAKPIENSFRNRVGRMRTDRTFKPASHMHACRYCPYKEQCEFVETGNKTRVKSSPDSWENQWKL